MPGDPSYTILNVDGNEAGRDAKTRILAPAGYHVIEARNETDALRLVREAHPHLVILGLGFPDLSGPEICRIIKTSPATAQTMVLQISAAGAVGLDPAHGWDGRADYRLTEPIAAGELLSAVRALLRLSQHEVENQRLPDDVAEGEEFIRRKRLEEAIQANEAGLVRSEQQFQDATEAAQCGMWDWDIATGRLDWLGAHERLAGLEPGSFSGTFEGFLNLLHPDDGPRVRHDLQAAMERRDTRYADEYRYLLPDGGVRWMAGTGRLFYDDAGQPVRMTGIVLDIHERKRSEERLRNKTARLALLADAAERLLTQECSVSAMEELYGLVAPHFGIDSYWDYDSDDEGQGLRLVSSAGLTEETAPAFQYLRFGEALCDTCAQVRAPFIVERLQESTDPRSVLVKQNGNRAYACYPLVVKGQLFGTLAFASRSREAFEPEETEFLGTIAHYVAMVKSRKRTEAGLLKRHKRAELLARVEATLLTADDSTALTRAFFDMIREDLGLDGYLSYTANENESLLILESSGGIDQDVLSLFQRIQPGEGLLGTSWEQRRSMVADRVQESQDPKNECMTRLGFRLYACYPLMIGERCLGVLSFGSKWKDRFDSDETDLIRTLCHYTAMAKERLRLLSEIRRREHMLMRAQRAAKAGLWEVDLRTGRLAWSEAYYDLFGLDRSVRPSVDDWLARVHPDDRDIIRARYDQVLIEPQDQDLEYRIMLPDGTVRWVQRIGQIDNDEFGRPVRLSGLTFDITERKRGEEALRASEERWQLAINGSTDGMWDWDPRSNKIFLSNRWKALRGYKEEEIGDEAEEWLSRIHPDDLDRVMRTVQLYFAKRIPVYECEYRSRCKDGSYRWIQDRGQAVWDEHGRVERMVGSEIDITARRRGDERIAELNRELGLRAQELQSLVERLRESEAKIKLITNSLPILIAYVDAEQRYQFNNLSYEQWFGQPLKSITGRPIREVVGEAAYEQVRPHIELVMSGKEQHFEALIHYEKLGSKHVDVTYMPDRAPFGEVRGFFVMVNDVTERRLVEEAFKDQLNLVNTITDNTPSCLLMMDAQGVGTFANPATALITGYEPEELIGKVLHDVIRHASSRRSPFHAAASPFDRVLLPPESIRGYEDEFLHKDGHTYPVRCAIRPILKDGMPVGTVLEIQDITKEKRAEQALREFSGQLEQRVKQRTEELVRSQARLRALATELNLSEQRQRRRLSEDLHDYLAQLLVFARLKLNQAKRAGLATFSARFIAEADDTLTQALTYTRSLIAELSPPVLRDFGLLVALQWLTDQMRRHELKVSLERHVEDVSVPEEQAVLLFQSVRELLINVSKHAGTDRAVVTVSEADGMLCIDVKDEGRGFEMDEAQTADNNAAPPSSHYGLFSIRERMCAMGGDFDLTSAPGHGTRATLVLPLTPQTVNDESGMPSDELPEAASAPRAENDGSRMFGDDLSAVSGIGPRESVPAGQKPFDHSNFMMQNSAVPRRHAVRILLADDHAMLRQGLRSVLDAYADVEIVGEACDGEQAISLAQSLQPEVVVMDVNMPGLDGIEATRQLRQEQPTISVVGLSVHNNPQIERAMREAGAAGFLTKDSAVEQLYLAIQQALGQVE